jgi:recombination DNA repair RAD52 pathway protein
MDTEQYQGDIEFPFTAEQIAMLKEPLDLALISERKGGGNTTLHYLEGHDAISTANLIFGFGSWGYRPLSCEQTVIRDALTGEAVGVAYKAIVELTVKGCVPIVDVGSQAVALWNVEDWMTNFYANAKKYNNVVDESEMGQAERLKKARAAIMESHEQAEKAAVTDALKRCLRAFGSRFGNDLYGKPKAQKPASAPRSAAITLQQVKAAVRKAGKASDADSWSLYILSILGEPLTDQELQPEHLKKLLDGTKSA